MKTLWVLVANSSSAKIFEVKGKGKEIAKLHDINNPDGRKKGKDLITDRPGRSFQSFGTSRHAVGNDELPHEHELQVFAHQLSDLIKKGVDSNSIEEIALIAPPQFLGVLRQVIPDIAQKLIAYEVDKDIVNSPSEKECIDLMCRYLDLWNR